MKILYCNVREMDEYNGYVENDGYSGGGSYTKDNIGHEVNNFTRHGDTYYGYVRATSGTIDIQKNFGASPDADHIDGVLVVWVCKYKNTEEESIKKIVGFYLDATVYRKERQVPASIAAYRSVPDGAYQITAKQAILIPSEQRVLVVTKKFRNIWYGDAETNKTVQDYLNKYQNKLISTVESDSNIKGEERECIIKQRVNQSIFRERMLERFHKKCALCGVSNEQLLIASHIKPWSKSNSDERVSKSNGLLLCPNHDKLFDKGYISFSDDGHIMISSQLSKNDLTPLNVNKDMKISDDLISEEMKIYLGYHRTNVFKI